MSDQNRILVVDDEPINLRYVIKCLEEKHPISLASSGEKALKLAQNPESKPALILLDVMMPGMDGYETCRELTSNADTQDIDIIFVTANDSVEEKLKGYDAGGIDYLTKPVDPDELQHKVELALSNREKRINLEEEKSAVSDTAMTALMSSGELGVVLEFLRHSFTVNTASELAKLVIAALSNYSLTGSVQIRFFDEQINQGTAGPVNAIDKELMFRIRNSGRILENEQMLFINFGDITLLVKSLAEPDPEKTGRIRDNLTILLEGANSRLEAIKSLHLNEISRQNLQKLVATSKQALLKVENIQKEHKENSVRILDSLLNNLEKGFSTWGLTDEQEQILLKMIQSGIDESMTSYENAMVVDETLQNIITAMSRYAE